MLLPALAWVLVSGPVQIDVPRSSVPFAQAPLIAEPNRIALTPILDGSIEEEEWDLLVEDDEMEGFLQWQPGKLHIAGRLPVGRDILLSMDVSGNGWLVGKDNLQVRVSFDGRPRVSAQLLDATNPHGPIWRNLEGISAASSIRARSDGSGWTFEATLEDPGAGILPNKDSKTFLRMDAVDFDWGNPEPFLPRLLAPVRFVMERSGGLLSGLDWKPEMRARVVMPGDPFRIRMNFSGAAGASMTRIEMRTEGPSKDEMAQVVLPFPDFDRRNRAFVDYESRIPREHPFGFRVMRGVIQGSDGVPALVQASYEVAPLLQFDVVRQALPIRADARMEKIAIWFQSNSMNRVSGHYTIFPPQGWRVLTGVERPFLIYQPRGKVRRVFELEVPGGAKGTYPLLVKALVGDREFEERFWVTVE
jgi:hypothetical protein